MIEPLLLSVTRITTMRGTATLSNATAFFFERDERLFLVTARHALIDQPSNHYPDHLLKVSAVFLTVTQSTIGNDSIDGAVQIVRHQH